ncbi:hypothetical protein H6F88_06100 [Oculatella sp. FACHB-28]|uniref:hypothetical protein n=1 Tax=Oculatella sp. FACHB-28 TaxID=2692845 RepID=UPI001687E0B6|nr:hypothetical protein [Oculatella sp. FACHB-28]MBD2055596.1 hypothetical protein [Oculatella sp. FACHB-28]
MLISKRWQSRTALFMALGMASVSALPTLLATPAVANEPYLVGQLFPSDTTRLVVPTGTVIPVRYEEAERIIVTPNETASVTLVVAQDVRSSAGTVLIPAGSEIEGELQPNGGGTQFVSEEITLTSGQTLPIDATSEVITDTQVITEDTDPDFLRGAVIGAAAAAVLSEIFGSIDFGEVLAGAGLGALGSLLLGGGEEEVEVVVVEPETDLDLTLQSEFER